MGKSVVFKSALAPEKKTSWWPIVAVFVAVLALAGGLIWLANATNQPVAAPEPEPTETPMTVQEAVELECAAELSAELGLDEPVELFDVEFSDLGDTGTMWAVSGEARYPNASGRSTTSDSFNCGVTMDENGDVSVTAWTY